MKKQLLLYLLVILLFEAAYSFRFQKIATDTQNINFNADNCNATHFQFHNNETFARGIQLNMTYSQLQASLRKISNVSYQINESVSYTIYDAKPTFYYHQELQRAEIVMPRNILVQNSYVDISLDFKWIKNSGDDTKNGTGIAKGKSQLLSFVMAFDFLLGNLSYTLVDYLKFDCRQLTLEKIDSSLSPQQKIQISNLLSDLSNITTLRKQLIEQVNKDYKSYLQFFTQDSQIDPYDDNFYYIWQKSPKQGSFYVQLNRKPISFYFTKSGIQYGYLTTIVNTTENKCGPSPPTTPWNYSTYGGSQSFISFTFMKNILNFAIQQSQLDTNLTVQNWGTKKFKFLAGDLYDILYNVSDRFLPNEKVNGTCRANATGLQIQKVTSTLFRVIMRTNCDLNIAQTKILGISLILTFDVIAKGYFSYMDFELDNLSPTLSYNVMRDFGMKNKNLANQILGDSLQRLYENRLFGSGWPLYPRKVGTKLAVDDNSILFY